jgi:ribosome-binding factor A
MDRSRVHDIKKERKKALYLREISALVQSLGEQEPSVAQVYVTHVEFSDDYGICNVYVIPYTSFSQEVCQKALDTIKLYKPSMRKALASKINPRYTPELRFFFDNVKEKQYKIDQLLDKVCEDLQKEDTKKD